LRQQSHCWLAAVQLSPELVVRHANSQ